MLPTSVKCSILALLNVSFYGSDIVDVQEVVRRATGAMQADWAAAPGFAFVQRDLATSKEKTTCKTHQVFMISGSDYYMPIAIDDVRQHYRFDRALGTNQAVNSQASSNDAHEHSKGRRPKAESSRNAWESLRIAQIR